MRAAGIFFGNYFTPIFAASGAVFADVGRGVESVLPSLLLWQNQYRRKTRSLPCYYLMAVGLILMVLFTGCNTVAPSQPPESVQKTQATVAPVALDLVNPGVLTVGSYVNYAPQEYKDAATGNMTGFDIDLIRAIGQRMKLKVQIEDVDFSSLVSRLVDNEIDIAISAIPITSEMQTKVAFIPYFKSGEAMLVEKGNPHQITDTTNLCGFNVGVKTDTLEQDDLQMANDTCKQTGKAAINIITAQNQVAVVQLLLTRRVFVVYQDAPAADYAIKLYPNRFELGGPITNITNEGIAVRKDNASMVQAVQAAFNSLMQNRTYHTLIMKWGLIHGEIPGDTRKKS